jgi:phosphoglycolate phosphatase
VLRAVLFDLDGTLSRSAPGILGSLRRAFAAVGLPPLTAQQEAHILGPPFYEVLPPIVGVERVGAVIAAYREYYAADGMFDTVAYDGIDELLSGLTAAGVELAVATSKPEHFAVPIVAHLGLADRFVTIGGDTMDGMRASKALVVGEVLARLGRPDPSTVVMVGDRSHDVFGAAAHQLRCYGAGWGYGAPGELSGAGAIGVFDNPGELQSEFAQLLGDGNG